jgi:hypothetical protein
MSRDYEDMRQLFGGETTQGKSVMKVFVQDESEQHRPERGTEVTERNTNGELRHLRALRE